MQIIRCFHTEKSASIEKIQHSKTTIAEFAMPFEANMVSLY